MVLTPLIYYGEEQLFLNAIPEKRYLLVCTLIKLIVHHIFHISTSSAMCKVLVVLYILHILYMFIHLVSIYCFLLMQYKTNEEADASPGKKITKKRRHTQETAYCCW